MKLEKSITEKSTKKAKEAEKAVPVALIRRYASLIHGVFWYSLVTLSVIIVMMTALLMFLYNRPLQFFADGPLLIGESVDVFSDNADLYLFEPKEIELKPHGVMPEEIDFHEIEADVVYAYNPATHQVFYDRNSDKVVAFASITKLMTTLVAMDHYLPTDRLIAGSYDPRNFFYWALELKEDDEMSYEDAMRTMLVTSYNDVAIMVAENHPEGYDGFIRDMNAKAESLGMLDTVFVNPTGLDENGHVSTARDLKRLIQEVLSHEEIVEITKEYSYNVRIDRSDGSIEDKRIISTNKLLGTNPYLLGLKTGMTADAGECFVGYWKASDEDQLVTIILNTPNNRFDETEKLFRLMTNIEYPSVDQ
jgi:D-alanyl-D-alanine carboxypeptidase